MNSSTYGVFGALLAMGLLMVVYRAISQRRNVRHGPPVAENIAVPNGHGTLIVRRPHAGLQGAARSLTVEVDSVARGKVKAGKAVAVALAPGWHSVRVTIGRLSSASLNFETVAEGSTVYEVELIPGAFSGKLDLRPV